MNPIQTSHSCGKYDMQCEICRRYFVGERGLKIHLSKSRCKDGEKIVQVQDYCLPAGNNSEVLTRQEQYHGTLSHRNLVSDKSVLERIGVKKPIKWPRMSDEKSWLELDKLVAAQLPDQFYDEIRRLIKVQLRAVFFKVL